MADLEEGLSNYLAAAGPVAALVNNRIYPLVIPSETARPALAYQRIATPERLRGHDGPWGVATARVQFTCEGRTYPEAKALAKACRKVLDGFRGAMGSGDLWVTILDTQVTNDIDGYSETELAPVVRLDVIIQFKED